MEQSSNSAVESGTDSENWELVLPKNMPDGSALSTSTNVRRKEDLAMWQALRYRQSPLTTNSLATKAKRNESASHLKVHKMDHEWEHSDSASSNEEQISQLLKNTGSIKKGGNYTNKGDSKIADLQTVQKHRRTPSLTSSDYSYTSLELETDCNNHN